MLMWHRRPAGVKVCIDTGETPVPQFKVVIDSH
jgi:hypothetical protein